VLKLKSLASALASQQAGDRLIAEIEDLIARQSANIRQTMALGHTLDQLTAQEKATHTVASSEQTSIGGQIDLLFSSLATQTAQPSTDPSAVTAKAVLDAMNSSMLKDTSAAAVKLTSDGPFPDAVTKQTAVKQYLVALLRAASSKSDAATRLTQAKNQLEQVMADQKDLNDVTKQQKLDPATLAQRQSEINDRADVAKALLSQLNPDATKQVDQAQQDMQKSAADLNNSQNNPQQQADAQAQQQAAQQALASADQDVTQQIAQVQQQQNQSPTQQMAQVQKALDEVKQAQQEQQVSPQEAAKDAQQAQQDALAQSPDAANALADAATQLQQQAQQNQQNQQNANSPQNANSQQQQQNSQQASNSQQSPQQNSSQQNQPNSDQASQDLAQAAQALQAQQAALQQAAQNYQALADAQAALTQAQQDAQAAQQNLQNSTGNNLTDPAHKLTDAQNQANQVAQNPSGTLPADAQQAVQQAAAALKNGTMQAVQANRSGAEAQTQQALSDLQKAQDAVGKAMAQVAQQSQQKMGQGQQQMAQNQQNQNANGQQISGTGVDAHDQQTLKGEGPDAQRGTALVVGGLSPKDREAITQYQAEKTPAEYAPLVQQYLKNLADASEAH
jgi:hypothetical protein